MPHHPLSHIEVLRYALDGARMERGMWLGGMTEEQEDQLDRDIKELERRLAAAEQKEQERARLP